MMQLRDIVPAFRKHGSADGSCPNCGGQLIVINQKQSGKFDSSGQALKLACYNHTLDSLSCEGYIRGVDGRAPFLAPPKCDKGSTMKLRRTKNGKPYQWECNHKSCRKHRWRRGDAES